MTLHKKHKIVIGILGGLLLILIISNFVISGIISDKVVEMLQRQHNETFHISIGKTKFGLFDRSLVFNGIYLSPTDSSMLKLQKKTLGKNSLPKLSVSRIKLKGIHLASLLFSKDLIINRLIIDDPLYQHFSNGEEPPSDQPHKPIRLDSISLKELNGFQLDVIEVSNLKIQMIDIVTDEITFENKPLNFEVTGMKLEEVSENIFKLSPVKESFDISSINVEFPNVKYNFSIEALQYFYELNQIHISNIAYKPLVNKLTLANSYTYNSEVYDLSIKDIILYNLDLDKVIQKKGLFMDSIQISGVNAEIYKDKSKPFDLSRRPKFPQQLLKQMKTPVLIPKISIKDSDLKYEENLEDRDIDMIVTMNNLKVNIFNVTSIEENRKAPLKIDISTSFMGKSILNMDMILPLADDQQTFFFSGYLGPSKMYYYDKAIIPALGLKILKGDIESLSFMASADNFNSSGTMKFVYHDLEAEVLKNKNNDKNKFLSWSVNNLIHKSNPGQNGELREGVMNFERTEYKGFWNYIWKTVQSGIVNSIAPFGKTADKVEAKKTRQLKREERKKKRSE